MYRFQTRWGIGEIGKTLFCRLCLWRTRGRENRESPPICSLLLTDTSIRFDFLGLDAEMPGNNVKGARSRLRASIAFQASNRLGT